jgi:hypothetical protein
MPESSASPPQVPPDVARYLKGATPETRQFDFLIGDWDVAATRFKEDGSILFQYAATWSAQSLNEGRMIIDDFKALHWGALRSPKLLHGGGNGVEGAAPENPGGESGSRA